MSISYNTIVRQVAIAINSLIGTVPTDLQATYSNVPLTAADFDSSIHPFGFIKDKVLNAQEGLIMAIASTEGHPWRELIGPSTIDGLAHGARIPAVGANGLQVVGTYGAVRDSTDGTVLTRKKLQQIRDRVANPNGMWIMPVYWFHIEDRRVEHTREEVDVDVCTYERPDSDSLDLESEIIVPDVTGSAMADGAVMECVRDDEFVAQSQTYGTFYQAWLTAIKSGLTVVEGKPAQQVAEKAA